jgi:hypothetical protein
VPPLQKEDGLIAYECPACFYVTSVIWPASKPTIDAIRPTSLGLRCCCFSRTTSPGMSAVSSALRERAGPSSTLSTKHASASRCAFS